MNKTKIPYVDYTWNPVTGCTPVSPGCDNCYAAGVAKRFGRNFKVQFHPERLDAPLHVKKPGRVLVPSMGDLFHDDVPFEFVGDVWDTIHDVYYKFSGKMEMFLLTKRPKRMRRFYINDAVNRQFPCLYPGVTAENQEWADERIPILLSVPAAKRWVSIEPMLEPVNIYTPGYLGFEIYTHQLEPGGNATLVNTRRAKGLDWVVVGAESGPRRRPCDPAWVRDIRDQCAEAGVPLFIKQLDIDGRLVHDIEQFPEDLRIREYPK